MERWEARWQEIFGEAKPQEVQRTLAEGLKAVEGAGKVWWEGVEPLLTEWERRWGEPAKLEIMGVESPVKEVVVPKAGLPVGVRIRNLGERPAQVLRAGLRFWRETGEGKQEEISRHIRVEEEEGNLREIGAGEEVKWEFRAEVFHDTPTGPVEVGAWVEWIDAGVNLLVNGSLEGSLWGWRPYVSGGEEEVEGEMQVGGEAVLPGFGRGSVKLAMEPKKKGEWVMALDSEAVAVEAGKEYEAGVWYRADHWGWTGPVREGVVALEVKGPQEEVVKEHHGLAYGLQERWVPVRIQWKVEDKEVERARLSLRLVVKEAGVKGQGWYDGAYLVPGEALQRAELNAGAGAPQRAHWEVRLTEESYRLVDGSPAPVVYLGDDWQTQGDWVGRYGSYCWILCAMSSPRDMVGGQVRPLKVDYRNPERLYATEVIGAGSAGEFRYTAWTGDPTDTYRHWLPSSGLRTEERRALRNPQWGERTYASWDDHGEWHPFDGRGPDLYVRLPIPEGRWQVGFYFVDWDWWNTDHPRAHRLILSDEQGKILCQGRVADFGSGVYKVYGVQGPLKLVLHIQKDTSVSVVLSGIFLDPLELPTELQAGGEEGKPLEKVLADYRHWQKKWQAELWQIAQALSEAEGLVEQWQAVTGEDREQPLLWEALWQVEKVRPGRREAAREAFRQYLMARMQREKAEAVLAWLQQQAEEWDREGSREWAVWAREEGRWLRGSEEAYGAELEKEAQEVRLKDVELAKARMREYTSVVLKEEGAAGAQRLLAKAKEWAALAETDLNASRNMVRTVFAVPETILRTLAEQLGVEALGEEGLLLLADVCRKQDWYALRCADYVREYERFVERYPQSPRREAAYLVLVKGYHLLSQKGPEEYRGKAESMAQKLAAEFPGSESAAEAAWEVGRMWEYHQDWEKARAWYQEVITRYPQSRAAITAKDDLGRLEGTRAPKETSSPSEKNSQGDKR